MESSTQSDDDLLAQADRLMGGGGALPAKPAAMTPPPVDVYDDFINQASKTHNIPTSVIKAVMGVESGGNHLAVSPKGARGLMQIMPATWDSLGGGDPHDPATNIDHGAKYLRQLADRFGEDWPTVLAAYNQGPTAVAAGRPRPKETINYVKKVTGKLSDDQLLKMAEGGSEVPQTAPSPPPTPTPEGLGSSIMGASDALGSALHKPADALEAGTRLATGEKMGWSDAFSHLNPVTGFPLDIGMAEAKMVGLDKPISRVLEAAKSTALGAAADEAKKMATEFAGDPVMWFMPASRLISLAFVPGMAKGAVEEFTKYGVEVNKNGMSPQAARDLVRAMGNLTFGAMAGKHALEPGTPTPTQTHGDFSEEFDQPPAGKLPAPNRAMDEVRIAAERKMQEIEAEKLRQKILKAQAKEDFERNAQQERDQVKNQAALDEAIRKEKVKNRVQAWKDAKKAERDQQAADDRLLKQAMDLSKKIENAQFDEGVAGEAEVGKKQQELVRAQEGEDFANATAEQPEEPGQSIRESIAEKQAPALAPHIEEPAPTSKGLFDEAETLLETPAQKALRETNVEREKAGLPAQKPVSAMRPFPEATTKYQQQVNDFSTEARTKGLTDLMDIKEMVDQKRGRVGSRSLSMARDILAHMNKMKGPDVDLATTGKPTPGLTERLSQGTQEAIPVGESGHAVATANPDLKPLVEKNQGIFERLNDAIASGMKYVTHVTGNPETIFRGSTLDEGAYGYNKPSELGGGRRGVWVNPLATLGRAIKETGIKSSTPELKAAWAKSIADNLLHEVTHSRTSSATDVSLEGEAHPHGMNFDWMHEATKGRSEFQNLADHIAENLPEPHEVSGLFTEWNQARIKAMGQELPGGGGSGSPKVDQTAPEIIDEASATPEEKASNEAGFIRLGMLTEPIIAVKNLAKASRPVAQAIGASRISTALNNFWNSGIRYSGAALADAIASPISSEARSALKGKVTVLPDIFGHAYDTLLGFAGKKGRSGQWDQAEMAEELSRRWLPKNLHDQMWHLLSTEMKLPGGGVQKPTPTEKFTRSIILANLLQERPARLMVLRAEMEPIFNELGVKDFKEFKDKVEADPKLLPKARLALINASSMALDMTAGAPPVPGALKKVSEAIQATPLSWAFLPDAGLYTRMMLHNMPQQILESNPLTMLATKRTRWSLIDHPRAVAELPKLEAARDAALAVQKASPTPANKLAFGEADRAFSALKGKIKTMEGVGLKNKRQIAEVASIGPIVVGLFAAKAMMEKKDDSSDWSQIDEGKGLKKSTKAIWGSMSPYALLGHYIGKQIQGSQKYKGREGYANFKEAYEALTQTRKGVGAGDILDAVSEKGTPTDKIWDAVERMGYSWGRFFGGLGMPGEVGRLYEEGTDKTGKAGLERTYDRGKAGPMSPVRAFAQGFEGQLPGIRESLPPAYSSTTGKPRKHEGELLSEYGPVPGHVTAQGMVDKFIEENKGRVNEKNFIIAPTRDKVYDEALFRHYREELTQSRIVDVISSGESRAAKVQEFEKEMARLRDVAHTEAKKEMLERGKELPETILRGAKEKKERRELQWENPSFYRGRKKPGYQKMRPFEEWQMEQEAERP